MVLYGVSSPCCDAERHLWLGIRPPDEVFHLPADFPLAGSMFAHRLRNELGTGISVRVCLEFESLPSGLRAATTQFVVLNLLTHTPDAIFGRNMTV